MIPCLDVKTLKMLKGTADERYEFSRELFRETHYPQVMSEFYKQKLLRQWKEKELLAELQDAPESTGNRVYIIFGSTGSGKSELLCWLRDQWIMHKVTRPVIRISRSELNPQLLIKKCYNALNIQAEDLQLDEQKWDILLKKPITIVNQIIWTALSEVMECDEEIVPVALLLRPVVERNIMDFAKQVRKKKISKPLQIITEGEFKKVQQCTTIPVEIKFKTLQDALAKKLEHFLFQGHSLSQLLKQLSHYLKQQGIRPLLLIDDLVQSVNLYAAEILDHFITLEEGNWDVVVGLTPGVVNATDYNKEFNQRVQHLDTIDDRVKKLWLSDEAGETFFSLSKEQAHEYTEKYLNALKKANGYTCSVECPYYQGCKELLIGESNTKILPFNRALISRIYDGIPAGKGVLRYMVLHMREILKSLSSKKIKDVQRIQGYIQRDSFVKYDSPVIKLLGEMFADSNDDFVTLPGQMLQSFGLDALDVTLPLMKFTEEVVPIEEQVAIKKEVIPAHFLDWVEGRQVNENVLDPLKKSTAQIVHEVTKGTNISRPYTPRYVRAGSTLQRTEVQQRYKYPIVLGESREPTIVIQKDLSNKYLLNFHEQKPQRKADLFSRSTQDSFIADWIYTTEFLKEDWRCEIEQLLQLSLPKFAHGLKTYMDIWWTVGQADWGKDFQPLISDEIYELIEHLYLDWFSLRDNMIDYASIELMPDVNEFEIWLKTFKPQPALSKYSIGEYNLDKFLYLLHETVLEMKKKAVAFITERMKLYRELVPFIHSVNMEYGKRVEDFLDTWVVQPENIQHILEFHDIENWFNQCDQGSGLVQNWYEKKEFLTNTKQFAQYLSQEEVLLQDKEDLERLLRETLQVRPQVQRQLTKLLVNGETILPRHQWKGIVRDLEQIHPDILKDLITVTLKLKPKIVS
ncbi:hypothetical protein [Ectobacillus funiculus]|uniref:hypothetical protein n=1 Tax=Ectobacillus funiculus TaxID=137993 RepID=UPI00101BDA5B|nr:hypothetical protein [Ectobacillus funiculus]